MATQITESTSDTDLSRVEVIIEPYGSDTASLTLDSNATGVTLTTTTAGAWDYTIDAIASASTDTLTPGYYTVTHRVTDTAGTVTTVSKGTWRILEK
ncbi:MAG TPA: hypothetical protein V6D20_11830 [Candidatus Obscuribacterales bacterium]